MPTNQGNFDVARSAFSDTVFVIPTFQRPYAWDGEQLEDLFLDITHAANTPSKEHYLSPIHLIQVDSPEQPEWISYTDQNNTDVTAFAQAGFSDENGLRQKVYLVVDGQQRLTTLFMLFAIKYGSGFSTVSLPTGTIIPRVILNPHTDHAHFRALLSLPGAAVGRTSRSQARLAAIRGECQKRLEKFSPNELAVLQNGLKTLLIELNAQYGLRGFLTLNDRGKPLTQFEKLKSLMMEYDLLFGTHSAPKRIHNAFGAAYVAMDTVYPMLRPAASGATTRSLVSDNRMLAFLTMDAWRVSEVFNESPDAQFSRYRKAPPSPTIVSGWLDKLDDFSEQIVDLTSCLTSSKLSTTLYDQSLQRTVADHYRVVVDSLELSNPSLSFTLKFHAMHKVDWHDRRFSVRVDNTLAINLLTTELNQMDGAVCDDTSLGPEQDRLLGQIDRFRAALADKQRAETRAMSVLDMAEWIELFVVQMGSRRDFASTWQAAFSSNRSDQQAFDDWAWFALKHESRRIFFARLLSSDIGTYRKVARHVLAEYEASLRATTPDAALAQTESLDLEHFLAEGSTLGIPGFPWCGLADENEYYSLVNSLGNLLLLDSSLNRALRAETPSLKLSAYQQGMHAKTIATVTPQQALRFSTTIPATTALKHMMRIRRFEIALFALERF